MHVDETPALWVVSSAAALDPIENEYVNLLRVVTGQWGARIVPAGAVVPFGRACSLHFHAFTGHPRPNPQSFLYSSSGRP